MDNVKTLAFSGTAIEKLPESIEKLSGLECLYLHNCRRLHQIRVDSFYKLTKLARLEAGSCGMLNWFKDQEEKTPVNLPFSHITRLHLNQNNISDELLAMVLGWFPSLHVLELRDNNITFLPACIKECSSLKRLYLDGCKKLREIRVIRPTIKVLSAVNCMSLTPSPLGLLSQALHEPGNTKFILPGEWIPECFRLFNTGSSVAFRVRKRFPEIAVFVVFDVKGRGSCHFEFEIQVLINDTHNFVVKTDVLDIETGHVYLFDDLWHPSLFESRRELPEGKFDHVRISCNAYHKDASSDAYVLVKCIGVYVYNFESCMDDIQFENPIPPKRMLDDWICDADLKSWVYSDSSREDSLYYKYYQAIEAYENSGIDENSYDINGDGNGLLENCSNLIHEDRMLQLQPEFCSDLHQQEHLTHYEEQILESSGNVRKAKEEDIVVCRDNVEMQRVQDLTRIQEKILRRSGNFGKAKDEHVLVYRDDANKEKDSNTLLEDPMEWEYLLTCRKDRSVSDDRSTERQRDWWYSCFCVMVSLVVLCRHVLLLLRLLHDSLGVFSLL